MQAFADPEYGLAIGIHLGACRSARTIYEDLGLPRTA